MAMLEGAAETRARAAAAHDAAARGGAVATGDAPVDMLLLLQRAPLQRAPLQRATVSA